MPHIPKALKPSHRARVKQLSKTKSPAKRAKIIAKGSKALSRFRNR